MCERHAINNFLTLGDGVVYDMLMKRSTSISERTASVRKASRDAAIGKGQPGSFNPNRSVRFNSKNTDKRAARGRTWKGE
jgi:hypothetical protein